MEKTQGKKLKDYTYLYVLCCIFLCLVGRPGDTGAGAWRLGGERPSSSSGWWAAVELSTGDFGGQIQCSSASPCKVACCCGLLCSLSLACRCSLSLFQAACCCSVLLPSLLPSGGALSLFRVGLCCGFCWRLLLQWQYPLALFQIPHTAAHQPSDLLLHPSRLCTTGSTTLFMPHRCLSQVKFYPLHYVSYPAIYFAVPEASNVIQVLLDLLL